MPVYIRSTFRTAFGPGRLVAPAPRLILLPDNLDPSGDPRPALALGRAVIVFATIPAALAAKHAMEAGQ